jgi:hypothetical protein
MWVGCRPETERTGPAEACRPRQIAKSNRLNHTGSGRGDSLDSLTGSPLQKRWGALLHLVPPICSWAGLHGLGAIPTDGAGALQKYQ